MRPIFLDTNKDAEILDKGYFVDSLLNKQQVDACMELYNSTNSSLSDRFYNTLASPDKQHRKEVNDKLEAIIGDAVRARFSNYRVMAYNFAIKHSGSGSQCHLHNDDWHANEDLYTCINIWIPLVDVGDFNGSLQILPKSHKLPYPIRGIGLPFAYEHLSHLIEPRLKLMEMKAGEGLFFHSRIIHGSKDNASAVMRPAIILAMLPEEARAEVFIKHPALPHGQVELFETPTNFYLETDISKEPVGFKSLGVYDYVPNHTTAQEFAAIVDN